MKKKFRNISVDGKQYGYTVAFNKDGDGGLFLKLWKDRKELKTVRFSGSETITPAVVVKEIRAIAL